MARAQQIPSSRPPRRTVLQRYAHAPVSHSNNPFVPPRDELSLINSALPPELLSIIFQYGLADDEDDRESKNIDALRYWDYLEHLEASASNREAQTDQAKSSCDYRSSPLFSITASHVCRLWRDVAISTPSLWSAIALSSRARPPYTNVLPLVERSKEHALDLDCRGAFVTSITTLFLPHVHRWRSMKIRFWSNRETVDFLTAVSDTSIPPASHLTALNLSRYHDTENDEDEEDGEPQPIPHYILFGGSAPRLQQLTLSGVHVDWDQSWISSASNLTHLELAYHKSEVSPSWAQFTIMLRGAPKLEKLFLRWSCPSGNPSDWIVTSEAGVIVRELDAPIPLPNLTHLALVHPSETTLVALLRRLYIPCLKNLSMGCRDNNDANLVRQLAGPAASIGPTASEEQPRSLLSGLEDIKLGFLLCNKESAKILCAELHSLKSLTVPDCYALGLLLSPCTLPGITVWLPLLQTIYVSWGSSNGLGIIREVVQKRKDAGVPLKAVYLGESCNIDDVENLEWLRNNVEECGFFLPDDDT